MLADWADDEQATRDIQARWDDAWNTRTHAMQFKDSVRTVTATEIQFRTPEIAVAHVSWGMVGDKDRDGTPRSPATAS